jgi:hypothetical protein
MKKIINYKMIIAENWEELEYKVNEYIKEGWQPYNNFYMSKNYAIIQPIVKYEEV